MNRNQYRYTSAAVFLLIILLFNPFAVEAQSGKVVLWNKLGSLTEVTHSEVGLSGSISGNSYAFEPGKFGNGYVRKANWNWLEFPGSVLFNLAQRGTVAMWITPKVTQPQPYNYGVFGLLGHPYSGQQESMIIYWGDGVTGQGIFGGVPSAGLSTPNESQQFVAKIGVPFHVALSWDINGINGSTDTLRVYRDGQIVGKSTSHWNPASIPAAGFIVGAGAESDGNSYDKYITDNLVVWDYAKNDFSDRFKENPISCEVGGLPVLSANVSSKSGTQSARIWTISLFNTNNCPAENAQIDGLVLTQTAGSSCAPVITNPLSFPLGVGNIAARAQVTGTTTINFTGCSNNVRFKATIPFSSNNGAVTGSKTLNNQFR